MDLSVVGGDDDGRWFSEFGRCRVNAASNSASSAKLTAAGGLQGPSQMLSCLLSVRAVVNIGEPAIL